MSIANHVSAIVKRCKKQAVRSILAHRICARHPTLNCDPTAIIDYAYDDLENIKIGKGVSILAFVELLVYRSSPYSSIPGEFSIGDNSVLGPGVNVRAAGGAITIGKGSGIAEYCVLVATDHDIRPGEMRIHSRWDERRTGVAIGDNVWIGANSVLLPGTRIGDNSVIGAGSVVRGDVPANEIWVGTPARRLRAIGESAAASREKAESRS
jgi:acetyltransferase-like isoleucine patch superfamily enzyme